VNEQTNEKIKNSNKLNNQFWMEGDNCVVQFSTNQLYLAGKSLVC